MNKQEYPLIVLQDWKSLLIQLRTIGHSYASTVDKILDDGLSFAFRHRQFNKFTFGVSTPKLEPDGEITYQYSFLPHAANSIKPNSGVLSRPNIMSIVHNWLGLVRQYDELNLTEEDIFTKQYEDEIYSEFEIVDPDADTAAFNYNQQLFLYQFAEAIQKVLIESRSNEDLIKETDIFKQEISKLPKRPLIRNLSRLLAKLRVRGIPIIKAVWTEAWREAVKIAVKVGIDDLSGFIHTWIQ